MPGVIYIYLHDKARPIDSLKVDDLFVLVCLYPFTTHYSWIAVDFFLMPYFFITFYIYVYIDFILDCFVYVL